jgi:cytochrome c biogenesis protein CcmG/thiol:disulfide interchange protein DsbE
MRRKSSLKPYAAAVLVLGLVVAFAWVNRSRLHPVVPGREAPDFSAFALNGDSRSLEDYQGKVLLVNIWATWCPPCKEEMPSLQRLYQDIGNDGFEIVAISIDAPLGEKDAFGREGGDLSEYARAMGLDFTILHDPSGKVQQTYQTTGVPESFVIDRDGVIIKKVAGATAWDAPENEQLVRRLLGG